MLKCPLAQNSPVQRSYYSVRAPEVCEGGSHLTVGSRTFLLTDCSGKQLESCRDREVIRASVGASLSPFCHLWCDFVQSQQK